ncbi:MAG: tRNA (adenosine(37)-N6)-dimethylallyltransferase MiaA [Nitrospirae bacterium]|nr:tRNA (adenosine(37)-N6)-dimethylallyltransferase MiaA [Nitrospirota bacterium]
MNKVIILLGPTGVGKTGAAILLAKKLDTEIISADSMQIYRHMDIGTAKPSQEERALVRHHMIDIVDPSQSYSAGQYIETIVPIIEGLHNEGKMPVIAGGTGLYIKAITRGIFSGPSADWDLRDELLSMEQEERGFLHNYLLRLDPEAAAKIQRNDTRRIVRAIEVCLKGDEKMSLMQERLTKTLPYEFIKIGLTRQRAELYRIIDSRVETMLQQGLEAEVRRLLFMNPDKTPLQAIGYKEYISYLKGEIPRQEAIDLIKRNTRRYAKRQFTWFRKEEGIRWLDISGICKSEEIVGAIELLMANYYPNVSKRLNN